MKYVPGDETNIQRIELSRRNLISLLAKLDGNPPNSACTLIDPDNRIAVKAVEDAEHYEAEGRLPGPMHEDTEKAMCTGDPCICENGIGCVTVPLAQW